MDPTVGADVQAAGGAFLFLLFCGLVWAGIAFICCGKIGKKCGFSFWWTAILMFLPITNIIMFLFLGYSKRLPLEPAEPKVKEKKVKKEDTGEKPEPDDSGKTGPEFCGEEEKSGGS